MEEHFKTQAANERDNPLCRKHVVPIVSLWFFTCLLLSYLFPLAHGHEFLFIFEAVGLPPASADFCRKLIMIDSAQIGRAHV